MPHGTRTFQIDFDFIDHLLIIERNDGGKCPRREPSPKSWPWPKGFSGKPFQPFLGASGVRAALPGGVSSAPAQPEERKVTTLNAINICVRPGIQDGGPGTRPRGHGIPPAIPPVAAWAESCHGQEKAGLMIRETLANDSRMLAAYVNAKSYRMSYRTETSADAIGTGTGAATFPNNWIRLRRVGNAFTSRCSL